YPAAGGDEPSLAECRLHPVPVDRPAQPLSLELHSLLLGRAVEVAVVSSGSGGGRPRSVGLRTVAGRGAQPDLGHGPTIRYGPVRLLYALPWRARSTEASSAASHVVLP